MTCRLSQLRMGHKTFQMNPIFNNKPLIRMIIYRFSFSQAGFEWKAVCISNTTSGADSREAMHVSLPNMSNQINKTIRNNSAVWKTDSECHHTERAHRPDASRCVFKGFQRLHDEASCHIQVYLPYTTLTCSEVMRFFAWGCWSNLHNEITACQNSIGLDVEIKDEW